MTIFKNTNFDERRNAAEAAKKAKLEKFRAMTAQIDEGAAERGATRQAIVAARDLRAAEREAARLADRGPSTKDRAAREIVLKAEQAERDAKAAEQVRARDCFCGRTQGGQGRPLRRSKGSQIKMAVTRQSFRKMLA